MKRLSLSLSLWMALAPVQAATPVLPIFPPLHFTLPHPETFTLENGLVVFLMENHELPIIQMRMMFKAGSQYDPADRLGLSSLWAQTWTEGGTLTRRPEDIERLLNRKAASISFSMDLESGGAGLSCRKDDLNEIYPVFVDLLLHPAFNKEALELARVQALESLRRMNDEPEDVSRREFRRLVYGGVHPYARIPNPTTLKAIRREDLIKSHQRWIQPNGSYMAIVGDFDSKAMKSRLMESLGSWPRGDDSRPAIAPVPAPPPQQQLFYVQRSLKQSQIRVGQLGLTRHSPDYFAWLVFNELWGASSNSRLFKTIRTQKGLAYSVGSAFSAPNDRGLIVAISQTRGKETLAAIRSILAIHEELREAPFTADEIKGAKDALINQTLQEFATPAQITSAFMSHAFFGFSKDYLDTYTRKISEVSAADLKRVAQTYMKPSELTILVIGDLSTFNKPISTLGKARELKPLDYTQDLQ